MWEFSSIAHTRCIFYFTHFKMGNDLGSKTFNNIPITFDVNTISIVLSFCLFYILYKILLIVYLLRLRREVPCTLKPHFCVCYCGNRMQRYHCSYSSICIYCYYTWMKILHSLVQKYAESSWKYSTLLIWIDYYYGINLGSSWSCKSQPST